ncbi:hypothetical protein KR026_005714 [Drosophila bipectinata]|nr:hypothetical protein KR026_005714 [Drosophila bipectinata]
MKVLPLYFLLIVLILLEPTTAKVFRVNKMTCQTLDSSLCHFKTCEVVHKENGRAALYFHEVIDYQKPIDDVLLNLGVFKILKNRRFQFVNETLDFCAFSRQLMFASGIFGFVMAPILNVSNINFSCPLQQSNIIFNGFVIDENTLKEIPIPNGVYMFNIRAAYMKRWATDVKIYASRVEKYS